MRLVACLSACLALCLPPALLSHCGGATNEGLMGTETGNPPVVDSQKLRLVAGGAGVELIAQPGAVVGGAQIRLDNRSTGASAVVTASADGSFRVEVTGTAQDTYEVTVTHQGGTLTLQVTVTTGEDLPPGNDPIELSCEQLENSIGPALTSTFASFATGCTNDSDCALQFWDLGCYGGCGYSYVLAGQVQAALAAGEQSIAPACSELERRSCPRPQPPGCPGGAPSAMCHRGTCQAMDLESLSCEDLEQRATQLVADTFASVDRSCNADADCSTTVVPGASCAYSCYFSGPLASSAVAPLQQNIQTIEEGLCGTFAGRGCLPAAKPPCAGPDLIPGDGIACVDNRCTIREEP